MEHQFPLPGVAIFILSVGLAWLAFSGLALLFARKFPNNPFSRALDDVYGSGLLPR